MKNEGASYVKLYGINLGDSMENAGQSLTENGWAAYSEDASGHSYLAMIEGEPYYVMLESDENGNLQDWYLNNWPEGDGIAEALENLKGGKTENRNCMMRYSGSIKMLWILIQQMGQMPFRRSFQK